MRVLKKPDRSEKKQPKNLYLQELSIGVHTIRSKYSIVPRHDVTQPGPDDDVCNQVRSLIFISNMKTYRTHKHDRSFEVAASSRVEALQKRIEEAASTSNFALAKSLKEERDRLKLSLTNRRNRLVQDDALRSEQDKLLSEIERDLSGAIAARNFSASKTLKSRRDQLLQELNEWDSVCAAFSSALASQQFSELQKLKLEKERIRVIWKERSMTLSKMKETREQWDREDAARSIRFQHLLSGLENRMRQALRDEDFNMCETLKRQRDVVLSRQHEESMTLQKSRDEELKREEMLRQIEIRLELAKNDMNFEECKRLKAERDSVLSLITLDKQQKKERDAKKMKFVDSLDMLDKKIRDAASRRDFVTCKNLKLERDRLFDENDDDIDST